MAGTTGDGELDTYLCNLIESRRNVLEVRGVVEDVTEAVDFIETVLEVPDAVGDAANQFRRDARNLETAIRLISKTGPIKTIADIVGDILDDIQDVARDIEEEARDIDRRIEESGLPDAIDGIQAKLDDADARLEDAEDAIEGHIEDTEQVLDTLDTIDARDPTGLLGAPARATADAAAVIPNAFVGALNMTYADVRDAVTGLDAGVPEGEFRPLFQVDAAFQRIEDAVGFLSGPLEEIGALLKPIEPVLDAADFVFSITVGPIIEYVQEVLGINALVDEMSDRIRALLPDVTVLDGIAQSVLDVEDALDDFAFPPDLDTIGAVGWGDDLIGQLVGTFGDPGPSGIGYGTDGNDTLVAGIADAILSGGAGDDLLRAAIGGEGVTNVLLAGPGKDVIEGATGPGTDILRFAGGFTEYSFTQLPGGEILFEHLSPIDPRVFDGTELVTEIEEFIFEDFSLTLVDLLTAVIPPPPGGGTFQGTPERDFLIAGAQAVTVDADAGNDVIVGSPQADILNGEGGDDDITGNGGDDTVDGGTGRDTFRYPDDGSGGGGNVDYDLALEEFFIGSSPDVVLRRVENVVVDDNREVQGFGDGGDNSLVSADQRDLLDGRGGDDTISGGADRDTLIGGPGVDEVYGGPGNDTIIVGDRAVPGGDQFYDGGGAEGEGANGNTDRLVYHDRINQILDDEVLDSGRGRQRAREQEGSGPIRLTPEGLIERLSDDGLTVLATDTAVRIERLEASDFSEVLDASSGIFQSVNGAEGDDTIFAGPADGDIAGGPGDDILVAGLGGASYFGDEPDGGGGGFDTLDLSREPDARWYLSVDGAIGSNITALRALDTEELSTARPNDFSRGQRLGSGNVEYFNVYIGGPNDDAFDLQARDRGGITILAGAGNDYLFGDTPSSGGVYYNLYGEDGDDRIRHTSPDDGGGPGIADGGAGNDEIELSASSSSDGIARGGTGDDRILIRGGRWEIDGGEGQDALEAAAPDFGLDLDLGTGALTTVPRPNSTTRPFGGTVTGIEIVIGADNDDQSGNFDENSDADTVTGSDAVGERIVGAGGRDRLEGRGEGDALYGGAEDDTLLGGEGDDLLHGGPGTDLIDGGPGRDTASWAYAAPDGDGGAVEVLRIGTFGDFSIDLAAGTATAGAALDTVLDVENAVGGSGDDTIRGTDPGAGRDGANALSGGPGADLLEGRGGPDALTVLGDDTARGGEGDDTITVNEGSAVIEGGPGIDTLDFGNLDGSVEIFGDAAGMRGYRAQVDVPVPVWNDDGSTGARSRDGVTLTPLEIFETAPENVNSPDDLDRTVPDDPAFEIRLAPAFRVFEGSFTGIERILGGSSDLIFEAGAADEIVLADPAADNALTFRAAPARVGFDLGSGTGTAPGVAGDTYAGFSILRGSSIEGVPEGDTLTGDAGDNVFVSGLLSGADRYDGRAGLDLVDYVRSDVAAVDIDLARAGAQSGGNAEGDVLTSIEGAIGTLFDDSLRGGGGDNILDGWVGSDLIDGRAGFDIFALSSFDTYGSGPDSHEIDLAAPEPFAEGTTRGIPGDRDRLISIEGVRGAATPDRITGDAGPNLIEAMGGDDIVDGGGGEDSLAGGTGTNSLRGGPGLDRFTVAGGGETTRIEDFAVAGEVIDLVGSAFGSVEEALARITKPEPGISRLAFAGSAVEVVHPEQEGTPLTAANFVLDGGPPPDPAPVDGLLRGTTRDDGMLLAQGATYLGRQGTDYFVVSEALLPLTTAVIEDSEPGEVELVGGLAIAASLVTPDAVQLTLGNGAVVQVLSAGSKTFDVGGNATLGIEGQRLSYGQFAADILGQPVPGEGQAEGGPVVIPAGSTLLPFESGGGPLAEVTGILRGGAREDGLLVVQGATYLGLDGIDYYVLSRAVAPDQTTVIDDTEADEIELVSGLAIAASRVRPEAVELTLANGAVVQILSATGYVYDVGGNATLGVEGDLLDYRGFVEQVLGVALPAEGEAIGGPVTIGETPGILVDAVGTYQATPEPDVFLVRIDSSAVDITNPDYDGLARIEGFDPAADILRFVETAGGDATEADFLATGRLVVISNGFTEELRFIFADSAAVPGIEGAEVRLDGIVLPDESFIEVA